MPRRKKQGDPAYGYRLQYKKQGEYTFSQTTYWRRKKDGPPPEWEKLKRSSQIVRGRLFRSGRMIDAF
jgi:hypothetical protein